MKKTLLEKAKETKRSNRQWREITPEIIELALAWAHGTIETRTATHVLGYKPGATQAYNTLARALRAHFSTPSANAK